MSEVSGDQPEVEQALARAVDALPGVLRLEPTLARAIVRLSRSQVAPGDATDDAAGRSDDSAEHADNASHADADAADGVRITNSDDGVAVTVEISVVGPGSALDTMVSVRKVVRKQLAEASLTAAAVSVRVLAVDAAAEAAVPAQSHDEHNRYGQKNSYDQDHEQHPEGHDHG